MPTEHAQNPEPDSKHGIKLDVVAHACDPSIQEREAQGHKFKVTLGYLASSRPGIEPYL